MTVIFRPGFKIQTTVTGYTAWVVKQMAQVKGTSPADVVRYIVERWVDDNRSFLEELGVRHEDFIRPASLVDLGEDDQDRDTG